MPPVSTVKWTNHRENRLKTNCNRVLRNRQYLTSSLFEGVRDKNKQRHASRRYMKEKRQSAKEKEQSVYNCTLLCKKQSGDILRDERCKVQSIKEEKWESVDVKCKNQFRRDEKSERRSWKQSKRWRLNGVLIPLMILNVTGQVNGAVEDITSRMIASLLGYPTSCNYGPDVQPCMLSISCWLRGGTRLRGCGGGWLFSCCGSEDALRNDVFENSIPSSEWKYKVVPPKLRQVPQRSVVPTNVFRRRVDDDFTQGRVLNSADYFALPKEVNSNH
ncbi:uncharacterized protein LOC113227537 [Hyposmocoma kahamanoa]|uniref:uncharacterized protein LOC113227537 n=1 Tax=Hyposmocoma kahamanoa TaxID=1477025 RepID=UPI000E6D8A9D|nr:uncharacterized protein LOC113227537 [Hyposmocoma kahamanoa]